MAAISAAEQVFSTPELLETVLFYLDQSALLICAIRVNHTFHAVISSSPSLQEHLFLRPRRPHRWDSLQANPLVFATLPVRFYYQELVSERRFRRDPDPDPGRAAHQPDDDSDAGSPPLTRLPTGLDVYRRIGLRPGEPVVDDRRSDWDVDDPFTRPEASWRRMLAVQPVLAASAAAEGGRGGSNGVGGTAGGGYCGGWRLSGRKKWSAAEAAYYTSHYDYLQRLHLTRGSPLPPESFLAVHADLRMSCVVARARRILTGRTTNASSSSSAYSAIPGGDGGDEDSAPLLFGIKFMMYEGDAKAAAGGGWARGGGALQQDGIEFRTRRGGKRIVFLRTDFPPGAVPACCDAEGDNNAMT
jgi:hypothetical protein